MAKRRYAMTERKVQKYLKEGRGQGAGADYQPWLTIHDFPSIGRVHRIFGLTTGRIHHLMSDAEARYFTQCDWRDDISDIREQFPLERDMTYRLARQAGIRHPTTTDGTPYILTTDFLLVSGYGASRKLIARTVKFENELNNPRVLEKFEIERRYWEEQGVDWGIVTEKELNHVLINNVDAVRGFADLTGFRERSTGCYQVASQLLINIIDKGSEATLSVVCKQIDETLDIEIGSTLISAKHLIAHKRVDTDMQDDTVFERRPLDAFSVKSESEHSNGI